MKKGERENHNNHSIGKFGDVVGSLQWLCVRITKRFKILKFPTNKVRTEFYAIFIFAFSFFSRSFLISTTSFTDPLHCNDTRQREYMQAHQIDHVQKAIMLWKFWTTISIHIVHFQHFTRTTAPYRFNTRKFSRTAAFLPTKTIYASFNVYWM